MASATSIGGISVTISANTAKFRTGLEKARKQLTRFTAGIRKAMFSLKSFALAMAGGIFVGMIRDQMQAIDTLAKTAAKLGVTTQALQSLRHAAELSGVASNTLDMALQRMTRRLAEAAQGTGEAKGALEELGLNAKFLGTLSPDQQMRLIADALQKVQSQSDRVRLAFKLFDSEGVALVNMLKDGSARLDAMTAELEKFGGAITTESAAKVEKANDAITRFKASIGILAVDLVANLAPNIEAVAAKMTEWATSTKSLGMKIADIIHDMKIAFKGLKATVLMVVASMSSKFNDFSQVLVRTLNKIPGVSISTDNFINRMNTQISNSAVQAQKDFATALVSKKPSEAAAAAAGTPAPTAGVPTAPEANTGVTSALGGIAARLKMRASRFAMEKGFQAKMLGRGASFLAGNALSSLNAQQPQVARLNNASIGAVDSNSAAGFAQRTRAMRNDPQMRIQKDQLGELRKIAANTKGEAGLPAAFA